MTPTNLPSPPTTSPEAPEVLGGVFPSPSIQTWCSWNECLAGHRWVVTMVAAQCPGCKSPILAVRKENCPYCNEPVGKVSLRSDHLPPAGGVATRCSGQIGNGETLDIVLERTHWKEAQDAATLFEERK